MGFGFPTPPGIPSYPGTPALNAMPGLQYNPVFDGQFAHGLTSNPYDNGLFEDLNTMQSMIYGQTNPPLGFPPGGPIPMQSGFIPPTALPPGGTGGTGGTEGTGGHGSTTGGATGGATGGESATGGHSTPGSTLNQHA